MIRRAFTMLELVFVIVVLGILAVAIIPQMDRDNIGEAAYQVARHVRLAQHYALVEDRFYNTDPTTPAGTDWRKTMWRITFVNGSEGDCYQVHADRDGLGGAPDDEEKAVDPMTKQFVWGGTSCRDTQTDVNPGVLLWKKFAVSSVDVCSVGGTPKNIAFDNMGRPGQIENGTMNFLDDDCDILITTNDGNTATVTVHQDTGFVEVILP